MRAEALSDILSNYPHAADTAFSESGLKEWFRIGKELYFGQLRVWNIWLRRKSTRRLKRVELLAH